MPTRQAAKETSAEKNTCCSYANDRNNKLPTRRPERKLAMKITEVQNKLVNEERSSSKAGTQTMKTKSDVRWGDKITKVDHNNNQYQRQAGYRTGMTNGNTSAASRNEKIFRITFTRWRRTITKATAETRFCNNRLTNKMPTKRDLTSYGEKRDCSRRRTQDTSCSNKTTSQTNSTYDGYHTNAKRTRIRTGIR